MQADESSVDNVGKGAEAEEKKLVKNPQNLFGFLDCKNIMGEDDSSMHEESENNFVPSNTPFAKQTENEQSKSDNIENLNNSIDRDVPSEMGEQNNTNANPDNQ